MNTIPSRYWKTGLLLFLLLVGTGVHAQTGGTLGTDISALLTFVDKYIIPLIFAIAFLVFLWGVFRYFIAGGGNDESRKEGRTFILYGIIGFVIMVAFWGILNILRDTICVDAAANCTGKPTLPTFGGGT
jgi:hypothetical protein